MFADARTVSRFFLSFLASIPTNAANERQKSGRSTRNSPGQLRCDTFVNLRFV